MTSSVRTAADLVNDILTIQPILGELINAIKSENIDRIDETLKENGYDVSADELQSILDQMHGDGKDIRLWCGLYNFTSPESLKENTIFIYPQTGKVEFNNKSVEVEVVTSDHMRWEYEKQTFDITFEDTYDLDDIPEPFTFVGTVITNGKTDQVKGVQKQ